MGVSPLQLGIILVIVVLIFGTKKLKNMGKDLGGAYKGFKSAMDDDSKPESEKKAENLEQKEKDADFSTTSEKDKADK